MIYLYSLLGLGGLAGVIYVIRTIKDWGKADYKKEVAQNESKQANKTAVEAVSLAQKWADSRGMPAHVRLRALAKTKPKRGS